MPQPKPAATRGQWPDDGAPDTTPRAARSLLALRTRAASGIGTSYPRVELLVTSLRCRDDLRRDDRSRRLAVPVQAGGPVTKELLVQRGLRAAWPPLRGRPEPRGVGREHLVGQRQRPAGVQPELQLGVRDDDPA